MRQTGLGSRKTILFGMLSLVLASAVFWHFSRENFDDLQPLSSTAANPTRDIQALRDTKAEFRVGGEKKAKKPTPKPATKSNPQKAPPANSHKPAGYIPQSR